MFPWNISLSCFLGPCRGEDEEHRIKTTDIYTQKHLQKCCLISAKSVKSVRSSAKLKKRPQLFWRTGQIPTSEIFFRYANSENWTSKNFMSASQNYGNLGMWYNPRLVQSVCEEQDWTWGKCSEYINSVVMMAEIWENLTTVLWSAGRAGEERGMMSKHRDTLAIRK